jgi:putative peptide zinc metalloprotease protein
VSSIAYNVMLISGISTLLFNGNPLLRFDGYYVLADAIEIPNLGTRANKYLGYLYQRYLCGVADAENPAESPGERAWMVAYGIAAFLYRMFIMFVIILFIAGKFFVIGVLLAFWAVATQVVVPMGKSLSFLATSPGLRRQRGRVMSTSVLLALALLGLAFVAPAPSWTSAQGVLWVPEEAQVRAGTEGFVERLLAPADSTVVRGQPLIEARDPFLQTRVAVLQAQLKELGAQFDALILQDRVQAAMVREEMAAVAANLERARQRQTELVIRSPADGRFVAPGAADLPGRFVTKGQLVAYVVEPKALTARVVVGQDEIGLVRQRTRSVEVMLAAWGADPLPARIQREVPGGSRQLPTSALGSAGGGPFAVDPRDQQGVSTLARVFQLELALPPEVREAYLGARIFVRFDHGTEPVGFQVYRALRQLLLRQFDV